MQEQKLTKRQEQALESRQRLLDAALSLFARKGYAETSVHALCTSLGMAASLLYHYFPGGKRELMQVIVEENMLQIMGELNALNASLNELPLEDVLEQLYQTIRDAVLRHGDVFRLFLQEQEVRELVAYERFWGIISARQQWFLDFLQRRADKGEIRHMDFECAAEALDSLMLHHLGMELLGISASRLNREENRKRLIAYQVGLWKEPKAGASHF